MRILAISDLRVQDIRLVERVAERVRPDLILYAGDDVVRFGSGPNSWSPVARRTRLGLAGVIGNDCEPKDASAFAQEGCYDLHRAPLLLDGLAILGLRGAPADEADGIGYTLYTQKQAQAHLNRQRALAGSRPILLVSHTPPRGILDAAVRYGARNIGSSVVRAFALSQGVRGIVCGHAHIQGGNVGRLGRCTVVNIASHDHQGAPLRYAILDWDGRALRVKIHQTRTREDLQRINDVGPALAERLEDAGFRSMADLLEGDGTGLAAVVGPNRARRIRAHARALSQGVPVLLERHAVFPSDVVIVDVETGMDRHDDPWLVGFKPWGRRRDRQIEELDVTRHRQHLLNVSRAIRSTGLNKFVQWSPFDRSAIERACWRVRLPSPSWLNEKRWLDACRWVRGVVALPVEGMSLKAVARYLGYRHAAPDLDGLQVGLWYSRYLESGEEFDVPLVRAYNRDDVLAVEHVVRSVRRLASSPCTAVEPPVKASRERRKPKLNSIAVERAVANYAASLRRRVAGGKMTPEARDAAVARYRAAMRRMHSRSTTRGSSADVPVA